MLCLLCENIGKREVSVATAAGSNATPIIDERKLNSSSLKVSSELAFPCSSMGVEDSLMVAVKCSDTL